jgi:hypothetical protein
MRRCVARCRARADGSYVAAAVHSKDIYVLWPKARRSDGSSNLWTGGPRQSWISPARTALRLLRCRGDISGLTTLLLLLGGNLTTLLLLDVSKLV